MAETAAADELRRRMEQVAGLVLVGPDGRGIEYQILTQTTNQLNYTSFSLGGFDDEVQAMGEGVMLATARQFNILGNLYRLQATPAMIGGITVPRLRVCRKA